MDSRMQSLVTWGGILLAALLVTPIIFRWLKARLVDDEDPATADERLDEFRAAREAGEIDEAEYNRLRDLIQQGKFVPSSKRVKF